jgi:hypothetical protein
MREYALCLFPLIGGALEAGGFFSGSGYVILLPARGASIEGILHNRTDTSGALFAERI